MPVLEAAGRPFSDVEFAGVALMQTRGGGLHTGLLYQLPDREPRLLHLAFHHDLRDEPPHDGYRWAQLGLDDVNKVVLAELAARVANTNPSVPYGFNPDGLAVDPASGEILPAPPGRGHTCATFVTALLRAHKFEVIDIATWPDRPDDAAFQGQIVQMLDELGHHEQAELVRNDIGASRLRPDEMLGAANMPDDHWPVEFHEARQGGDEVQSDLAAR